MDYKPEYSPEEIAKWNDSLSSEFYEALNTLFYKHFDPFLTHEIKDTLPESGQMMMLLTTPMVLLSLSIDAGSPMVHATGILRVPASNEVIAIDTIQTETLEIATESLEVLYLHLKTRYGYGMPYRRMFSAQ